MQIRKVAPAPRQKGRWLAYLESGDVLDIGEGEMASFALYAGKELTDGELASLRGAAQAGAVRSRALDLLAARAMSRRELLKKLAEKGAPEAESEMAADWLESLGYLNDMEYGKSVVRRYSARGYGARRLCDELYRRGVPREYWDAALEEAQAPENGVDAFLRQKLKGQPPDEKELRRLSAALARRGFRWDEIRAGLQRYGVELEEE